MKSRVWGVSSGTQATIFIYFINGEGGVELFYWIKMGSGTSTYTMLERNALPLDEMLVGNCATVHSVYLS